MGPVPSTVTDSELPPHTRRKAWNPTTAEGAGGTTSAYAEKRSTLQRFGYYGWNYLRIRGEKC
ncbi:Uncharacterised protein [Corynebacterium ulcerans]|uniref:Uncharacterized protein n=1 Tax=Corynebacterium ulcerans TaxID=65058 RepID=A0ABD7MUU6_CORUL|nr:Uncharacterised protein [Corynebacterium ulcerans]